MRAKQNCGLLRREKRARQLSTCWLNHGTMETSNQKISNRSRIWVLPADARQQNNSRDHSHIYNRIFSLRYWKEFSASGLSLFSIMVIMVMGDFRKKCLAGWFWEETRITSWILPGPLLSWQSTWKGRFPQQVCRATWKSFLMQIFFRDENKV